MSTPTLITTAIRPAGQAQITATVRCKECGFRLRVTGDTIADIAALIDSQFLVHLHDTHHPASEPVS
jgi:hypothetical protein